MDSPHSWSATSVVLLAIASVSPSASGAQSAARAMMFRGDPSHSGVYATRADDHYGGLAWRLRTRGPVRATPTVIGGTVFVGSTDGRFYAVDARTGIERWHYDVSSAISSSAAVANARVYFGSVDGGIYALDERHGTLVWHLRTGPTLPVVCCHQTSDHYTSSPTVVGKVVVIGAGDGYVYCLDAATGTARWTYETGARVRASPAVDSGVVYVGNVDGSVFAIDLATGGLKWRFETEGHSVDPSKYAFDRHMIQSSPAVVGTVIVFGSRDGYLYAVDRHTGTQRWRVDHQLSWVNGSPAAERDAVYSGTSDGRFFQRVDPATGKEAWRDTVNNQSFSSPAIAGSTVYTADRSGTLYVRDKQTGARRWVYTANAEIWSSPVVADDIVYFGCDDGSVYALRLTAGPSLHRAVFWDSTYVPGAQFQQHHELKAYLADRGYEVLDVQQLPTFLADRVTDGEPSVVVFAIDYLPLTVAPVAADTVLFRRYLNKGGKVVWLGWPPFIWPRDPHTGAFVNGAVTDIHWDEPKHLLGVDADKGLYYSHSRATPTPDGARWGLSGWWLSLWSVDPATVTTALGIDETGLAAAWVRSYGGPPGTGFVQLYAGYDALPPVDLQTIRTAAEYFPE